LWLLIGFSCLGHQKAKKNVQDVQDKINSGVKSQRSTIFHSLLDPNLNTAPRLPTVDDMAGQAFSFCVAASDTAGNAMTTATYYTITKPEIYDALKKELRGASNDPNQLLGFTDLEALPYLTGVIKEALR